MRSPARLTPRFFWENLRYPILILYVVAGILTPTPYPSTMLRVLNIVVLPYVVGGVVAGFVTKERTR